MVISYAQVYKWKSIRTQLAAVFVLNWQQYLNLLKHQAENCNTFSGHMKISKRNAITML